MEGSYLMSAKAHRKATAVLQLLPPTFEQYAEIHHAVTLGYLEGYQDGHHDATEHAVEVLKGDAA